MHNSFTNVRIIDLDSVIVRGSDKYRSTFKYKNNEINLGGLAYLMEICCTTVKREHTVIVLARSLDYPDIDREVKACRDPLTRLQYEIVLDKLEMTGIKVLIFNSESDLADKLLELTIQALEEYNLVRVYTDRSEVFNLVDKTVRLNVVSDIAITGSTFVGAASDVCLENNNYMLYSIASKNKEGLGEQYPKIVIEYQTLIKSQNKTSKFDIVYNDPKVIGGFILSKVKEGLIPIELAKKLIADLNELANRVLTSKRSDMDKYNGYNIKGMVVLLQMLYFKPLINYILNKTDENSDIEQSELENNIKKTDRAYINEKLGDYVNGEVGLRNNISLATNLFSDKETITLKTRDGVLIKETSVEDEVVEELDFLLEDFL